MDDYKAMATLGNLELPDGCHKISFTDFVLRKCPNHVIPEQEYDENGHMVDINWVRPDDTDSDYPMCDYYLKMEFTAEKGQGWRAAETLLVFALTRLRLFQKGELWGSLYSVINKNEPGIVTGLEDMIASLKRRPQEPPTPVPFIRFISDKYQIERKDIRRLQNFVNKMPISSAIQFMIPISRFNQSFDRDIIEDKAIDLFITLESLLSEGPEAIGYKIALRAAGMIGKNTTEKSNIFSFLKKAYGERSRIVHGSQPAAAWLNGKSFSGKKNLQELEDIARRILRKNLEWAAKNINMELEILDKLLFLK